MNALVIDLTHGGLIIALELAKRDLYKNIWTWDIYNTSSKTQKDLLKKKGIKLMENSIEILSNINDKNSLKSLIKSHYPSFNEDDDLTIIFPIHCPLNMNPDFTHHQIIKLILKDWNNPLCIEVTGVKGKTSAVGMLKEILAFKNPLVLSSLGAEIKSSQKSKSSTILKKNISITPASIIETIQLAENYDYDSCIFETSLGATGMADVGLLTNIVEDYPIARGISKASEAKKQIFDSSMVCCEYETFCKHYSDLKNDLGNKLNTFSFNNYNKKIDIYSENKSNLYPLNINYGFKKSSIEIKAINLRTIKGNVINETFTIETFSPSPYQIKNVLAVICCALTADIKISQIQEGLRNFKGLEGRSSLKKIDNVNIIQEINPGINVTAIENALNLAQNLEKTFVILGGEYGITCEEINENDLADLLKKIFYRKNYDKNKSFNLNKHHLILTGDLGKGIKEKMDFIPLYAPKPSQGVEIAIQRGANNIILIYRSNYANLKKR
jgi:UDP-N-acetylmuramyl pentapeptide synthase